MIAEFVVNLRYYTIIILMINNLKTIDQGGIKVLLKERIEHPEKYVDTPLIIWRADIRDGIHEQVLKEIFKEYNSIGAHRSWYKIASVRQMSPTKRDQIWSMLHADYVDLNDNKPFQTIHGRSVGPELIYDNGLFVIDSAFASQDYSRNPETLINYHSLLNNREWQGIKLSRCIPLVAYMCVAEPWFETPEAYPNAEQYLFKP